MTSTLGLSLNDLRKATKRAKYENAGKISFDYFEPTKDDVFGNPLKGAFRKAGGLTGLFERSKNYEDLADRKEDNIGSNANEREREYKRLKMSTLLDAKKNLDRLKQERERAEYDNREALRLMNERNNLVVNPAEAFRRAPRFSGADIVQNRRNFSDALPMPPERNEQEPNNVIGQRERGFNQRMEQIGERVRGQRGDRRFARDVVNDIIENAMARPQPPNNPQDPDQLLRRSERLRQRMGDAGAVEPQRRRIEWQEGDF